jgi:hypothetical protein
MPNKPYELKFPVRNFCTLIKPKRKKMKQFSLLVFLVASTFAGLAQSSSLAKEDYLQKSKRQKKTAVILICSGGALTLTGAIIGAAAARDELANIFSEPNNDNDKKFIGAGIILFTGLGQWQAASPFLSLPVRIKKRQK